MTKLKIHPLAETYPPMSEVELEALTADIAERGLQREIVLFEGMVLDGRNRLTSCEKAGVEPRFTTYEGDDPLGQVNSLNLNRDLTSAQRALIVARQWGLDGYSKGGRPGKGKPVLTAPVSLETFARQFRVGKHSILQARDLLNEAPDLVTEVESCALSLAKAHERLQERRNQAKRKAKDTALIADYKEAISNGEMTFEEAMQRAMEEAQRKREEEEAIADGQRTWLKGFVQTLDWVERFVAQRSDDCLASYTEPGSAGLFEHGITVERIDGVIEQLTRAGSLTFKDCRGRKKGKK
jgi:hypothetical protein